MMLCWSAEAADVTTQREEHFGYVHCYARNTMALIMSARYTMCTLSGLAFTQREERRRFIFLDISSSQLLQRPFTKSQRCHANLFPQSINLRPLHVRKMRRKPRLKITRHPRDVVASFAAHVIENADRDELLKSHRNSLERLRDYWLAGMNEGGGHIHGPTA
jgi:hypothetical protein